jgi:hypothetical protein
MHTGAGCEGRGMAVSRGDAGGECTLGPMTSLGQRVSNDGGSMLRIPW